MPDSRDNNPDVDVEDNSNSYRPFYAPWHTPTCDAENAQNGVFFSSPFVAPLLFPNSSSDARDHCANERTFLSYLRLSIYMSIVSMAILLSFHVRSAPTELELKMAKPLGIIFWVLGVVCLAAGGGNYVKTIEKYGKRRAIVQTGWKTQIVFGVVAASIVGVCILLLITNTID